MSNANEPANPKSFPWLTGRGLGPSLQWSVGTDGPLTALCLSRESGDIYAADRTGAIQRIDRRGRVIGLTRLSPAIVSLAWSDDGSQGVVIVGENEVIRLGSSLNTLHKFTLPDVCLAAAVSPFGHHLAVSLANGMTLIYNERNRKIAQYETMRPLSFLRFCVTEPLIFAAAEHGLICCHNLSGAEIWRENNLSNVGKMVITGEGDLIYMASFAQGVQAINGDGEFVGSYIVEGTVNRVDASYEPERVIISTIEQSLYWLDADGDQLWRTETPDQIVDILCDPLGEWAVVGFQDQGIHRLNWADNGT